MTSRKPRLQIQLHWRKQKVNIYQLKADALKAMLKALPDAQTVRGYEAPQPTTVPSAQEAASVEEEQAVPAQSEGSDFSDGSADAFSSDAVDEQAAETVDKSLRQKQQKLKILKMSRQMLISPLMRKFRQQVIPLSVNLQKQS